MKRIILAVLLLCIGYFTSFAQDPFFNFGVVSYSISPIVGTQDIQITINSVHPSLTHYYSHSVTSNQGVTNISVCMAQTGLAAIGYETTNLTIANLNASGNQTIILLVQDFQQNSMPPETCGNSIFPFQVGPYTINFMGPITQTQTYVLSNENFTKPISKLYPNPTHNIFQIDLPNQLSETQVQVFDFLGKEIMKLKNYQSGSAIDVSTFSAGLYFAKISTSEHTETLKFLVE